MRALWAGAALAAVGGVLPAAAEICSSGSLPEVRYCQVEEFCCGKGCCPRSMLLQESPRRYTHFLVEALVNCYDSPHNEAVDEEILRARKDAAFMYFFKLSVAVVLIVMILVWLCNYLRRGRSHPEMPPGGIRPRSQPPTTVLMPPPPYGAHGARVQTQMQTQAQARAPFPATERTQQAQHTTRLPPPDDLPPPYHTVVNMPPAALAPTHLPSYDASCKATTGPA